VAWKDTEEGVAADECTVILLGTCYQPVLTLLLSYRNEVAQLYF
jgi:hypothetical protein